MKRLLQCGVFAVVLLLGGAAQAQGPAYPYSVLLTWNVPVGTAPASYNVYRATYASGACGVYAVLNTAAITVTTYTDSSVATGGQYCYEVTAVAANGAESGPDVLPTNPVSLPPAPPTGISATVK